jgi:hypothetical protein
MEIQEIALDAIDLDFERFRIIDPRAEARMLQSMKTHGQLSPLFAGRIERRPLLIDGFKRYRVPRGRWVRRHCNCVASIVPLPH